MRAYLLPKIIMDSEEDLCTPPSTPPDVVASATLAKLQLLPEKSKEKYESAYVKFMDYRQQKHVQSFSENVVLSYFAELSTKFKSSTLWSCYSMLRSMLAVNHDIDLSKYLKLRAFLKRKSTGYVAKKSKILNQQQIDHFILNASDDTFLAVKVS